MGTVLRSSVLDLLYLSVYTLCPSGVHPCWDTVAQVGAYGQTTVLIAVSVSAQSCIEAHKQSTDLRFTPLWPQQHICVDFLLCPGDLLWGWEVEQFLLESSVGSKATGSLVARTRAMWDFKSCLQSYQVTSPGQLRQLSWPAHPLSSLTSSVLISSISNVWSFMTGWCPSLIM